VPVDRPFDTDGRCLAERDIDAEVACQRRLDDLLLHLAVQRDGCLLPSLVAAEVDQRVLLGELDERNVQRTPVGGTVRDDHRLQCRWGKLCPLRGRRARLPDRVADLDVAESPQLPDLPCGDRRTPDSRAAVEHTDRSDLLLDSAHVQPVSRA